MKVLYVTYEDLSKEGGATVHAAAIANRLAARGHEVWICAPDGELSPEIKVEHLPMTKAGNFFARLFWHLIGSMMEIVYWGFQVKPDVLYVRGIHATLAPAIAALLLGRPCVFEINGLLELETGSWWRRLVVRLTHLLSLWTARAAVTVSPVLKEGLCRRYGVRDDKVFVVPNGADCEKIRPADRLAARRKIGLDEAATIVLYVGGFYPHHGLELLVDCAPEVMGRVPTTLFVLVGDGATKLGLETAVREKWLDAALIFAGEVPHGDVADYLAAADVCIYTLRNAYGADFGFSPLKMYEYMAAGRPIVAATDMEDLRAFVNEHAIGVAEPLGNGEVARVSETLARMLSDVEMRDAYGAQGRKLAETVYNWDRACDQVERILRQASTRQ